MDQPYEPKEHDASRGMTRREFLHLATAGGLAAGLGMILPSAYTPAQETSDHASQSQKAQATNQDISDHFQEKEGVGIQIPLYYDQLTGNEKTYMLNAKQVYKMKVATGDTISKYVRMEQWPSTNPASDSLIGVIYTALNGRNADINVLRDEVILEDVDGDGKIFGRPVEERILAPEVVNLIRKNVYNGDDK
jgi:hypothetical protein